MSRCLLDSLYSRTSPTYCCFGRREGQHTQEELQKINLRDELEERERRHFSSKDKSYNGKIINFKPFHYDLD
jgi:N-methylhydantoinase A/oxoprolinase/acetone carboxylase beta subunit